MANLFFGIPDGIEEGQVFPSRKALIDAGLHRSTMHGIDGNGDEGVAAIVLSGGYEDDVDWGDEILYTGHGGNDPQTGKQIADQSWDDHGNKGLVVSELRQLPVRVIRGFKHNSVFALKSGYKFDGLYRVVSHKEEKGKHGFKICRFNLIKLDKLLNFNAEVIKPGVLVKLKPKGLDEKWFSLGVDAPENIGAQSITVDGKFGRSLLNKNCGDIIDFGIGFEVLEIKRYLSK